MLYFHCNCKDPLLSLGASFKRERTLCYLALGSGWPSKLARLHQTPKYNAVSTCFSSIHSQLLSCSLERRFFKEHCCHLLLVVFGIHCWHCYALVNTQQVKKFLWILFQSFSFVGSIHWLIRCSRRITHSKTLEQIRLLYTKSQAHFWVTHLCCFLADAGFIDYYGSSSDVGGNCCAA